MAIQYRQPIGTLLLCEFKGLMAPEMTKKRPVIVLAARAARLCIVVPLSTSEPVPKHSWHCPVYTPDPLPAPYDGSIHWAKCDMIFPASYERLFLPYVGKDAGGNRIYDIKQISVHDLSEVKKCVALAMGLDI